MISLTELHNLIEKGVQESLIDTPRLREDVLYNTLQSYLERAIKQVTYQPKISTRITDKSTYKDLIWNGRKWTLGPHGSWSNLRKAKVFLKERRILCSFEAQLAGEIREVTIGGEVSFE